MMLDLKKHLVFINGEDKTKDIRQATREAKLTQIVFRGSDKKYSYRSSAVQWYSDPVKIPVEDVRVAISGDILSDVVEILRFDGWIKVFQHSGDCKCFPFAALSIQQMKAPDGRSRDVLAYFRELAEGSSLKTAKGASLLAAKYQKLANMNRRSVLSRFLLGKISASGKTFSNVTSNSTSQLIFPFGCNMSQKLAVQQALRNPVSVIQGPPGTGKTQTILNLISNLLLDGKRVAVVSSNNSATKNVFDKLKNYELDFLCAFLGNSENKAAFIEGQEKKRVNLPLLNDEIEASLKGEVSRLNQELDKAFEAKNELATVTQQIAALKLELDHFEKFLQETKRVYIIG